MSVKQHMDLLEYKLQSCGIKTLKLTTSKHMITEQPEIQEHLNVLRHLLSKQRSVFVADLQIGPSRSHPTTKSRSSSVGRVKVFTQLAFLNFLPKGYRSVSNQAS